MINDNAYMYSVIVLFTVIVIKYVLTKIQVHEPLAIFQLYCQKLALKVNKPHDNAKQKSISGGVSIIITLAPLLVILWLFADFIEVTMLWDGFLLYLALGSMCMADIALKVAKALGENDKETAKSTLQPWVLRDTSPLSAMGLSKATIEMLALRSLQGHIAVAFYFLLLGPLPALMYRLLLEMHYSWNAKDPNFSAFGRSIHTVIVLLLWLPTRILVITEMVATFGKRVKVNNKVGEKGRSFWGSNNDVFLANLAGILNIQLGGVAMYRSAKLRRIAFNTQAPQPNPQNIVAAVKHFYLSNVILTVLLGTTAIVPWLFQIS